MYLMPDVTIISFATTRPQIADDIFVASGARLIGDLRIGPESSVWFNCVLRADVNHIRIGARTNIQDNTVIHVAAGKHPSLIGNDVTVGHSATIHACTIADRCLIGMGATILDGARIEEDSLVAAGALVPPGRSYPARSLIVGSPAVAKRSLTAEELQGLRESAHHYVELRLQYREHTGDRVR